MPDPILELLAAPPSPSLSVDEQAVYAGGRRRLRRRTLRRSAVGVVGVVGVAAIAFGGLGTGLGTDALPAGPTPTTSASGRVSALVLDGRYEVEVVPGAGKDQPNVIFYSITNGKRNQLAGSSASSDVVSLGTGSGADGVMLGTAPAGATSLVNITRPSTGGLATDQQRLPGTDYQAIALDFEKESDVDGYIDTIWRNAAGEVRNARGDRLPGVAIPGTSELLFIDRANGRFGSFRSDGGVTKPLTEGNPVLGTGEKSDTDGWKWRSTVVLPRGAHAVSFDWNTGTTSGKVALLPVDDETTLATATATAPAGHEGPILRRVNYTDSASEQHTVPAG